VPKRELSAESRPLTLATHATLATIATLGPCLSRPRPRRRRFPSPPTRALTTSAVTAAALAAAAAQPAALAASDVTQPVGAHTAPVLIRPWGPTRRPTAGGAPPKAGRSKWVQSRAHAPPQGRPTRPPPISRCPTWAHA
jgi:hypothetical protein